MTKIRALSGISILLLAIAIGLCSGSVARAESPPSVSLSAENGTVKVGESIELKAVTSSTVSSTPYTIRIVEDGSESLIESCGSGTECSITVPTTWEENEQLHARRFHAVIGNGSYTAGESSHQTVFVQPFIFTVNLSLKFVRTDGEGHSWDEATATTNRNVGPTPYYIEIREGSSTGSVVASCGSGTECSAEVRAGKTYWAGVEDAEDHVFGGTTMENLAVSKLTALFSSPSQLCEALLFYPGTHLEGASTSDQENACLRAAAVTGATAATTLAAAEAANHLGNLNWWLLHEGTLAAPSTVFPAPSETDPVPMPEALPEAWPVEEVAETLIELNPGRELSNTEAKEIAARCLWETAGAGLNGAEECTRLPIFLSGSDVPSATEHDLKAIATHPEWAKLNYESAAEKIASGASRKWYSNLGGCSGEESAEQQCDEYPFFASQQGGPGRTPMPSLEFIDRTDNELQGSRYSGFVISCKMAERSESDYEFLAIPLPPVLESPPSVCVTSKLTYEQYHFAGLRHAAGL
jgi:hypothetical protein